LSGAAIEISTKQSTNCEAGDDPRSEASFGRPNRSSLHREGRMRWSAHPTFTQQVVSRAVPGHLAASTQGRIYPGQRIDMDGAGLGCPTSSQLIIPGSEVRSLPGPPLFAQVG
jgi:hypothetical protein